MPNGSTASALKDHPDIQLRMGIYSGPVNEVLDVNERRNVAGAGIDIAQRETALTLQPNLGEAVLAEGFYHYACLKDYGTAV